MSKPLSATLPDDLTDVEDFTVPEGSAAGFSTLEEDLTAQLFGEEEDDDFAAGLFSDEEKFDDDDAQKPNVQSAGGKDSKVGLIGDVPTVETGTVEEPVEPSAGDDSEPHVSVAMGNDMAPAPTAPPSDLDREADFAKKGDKQSRFTKDPQGNLVYKWKADYAQRGGGGRAQCRDLDCLERHDQAGVRVIEKGCLRIGRRVYMPGKDGEDPSLTWMWYHARCIFNAFLRSRKGTRVITHEDDIENFHCLKLEDQSLLRRIIDGNADLKAAKFESGGSFSTPPKRGLNEPEFTPASKRRKNMEPLSLKSGDRVWTHCRVRAPNAPAGAPPSVAAVKSPKPELAVVVEEPKDRTVIVQFESQEHEKQRLEKYGLKKYKAIRGWLRYPRIFEGKKQRVPIDWIKTDRPPPRLCGCCKESWGHCSKGHQITVWGVAVDNHVDTVAPES